VLLSWTWKLKPGAAAHTDERAVKAVPEELGMKGPRG